MQIFGARQDLCHVVEELIHRDLARGGVSDLHEVLSVELAVRSDDALRAAVLIDQQYMWWQGPLWSAETFFEPHLRVDRRRFECGCEVPGLRIEAHFFRGDVEGCRHADGLM